MQDEKKQEDLFRLCHDPLNQNVSHMNKKKNTYQSSDWRGQPVNPLDDTGLDLVDQTVSKRKRKRESASEGISESTWSLAGMV